MLIDCGISDSTLEEVFMKVTGKKKTKFMKRRESVDKILQSPSLTEENLKSLSPQVDKNWKTWPIFARKKLNKNDWTIGPQSKHKEFHSFKFWHFIFATSYKFIYLPSPKLNEKMKYICVEFMYKNKSNFHGLFWFINWPLIYGQIWSILFWSSFFIMFIFIYYNYYCDCWNLL